MERLSEEERRRELDKLSLAESHKANDLLTTISSKIDASEEEGRKVGPDMTLQCVSAVMAMPFSNLLKKEGLHCLRRDTVRGNERGRTVDYDECLKIIDDALAELGD